MVVPTAQATTLTTLLVFNGTDGEGPYVLIQAADGSLYGVTAQGGTYNGGTIFKITNGTLTKLHSFARRALFARTAMSPNRLIQSAGGAFYRDNCGRWGPQPWHRF